MRRKIQFEKFNPFRRPDWRFERVKQLVDGGGAFRCTPADDANVAAARKFVVRYRNSGEDDRVRLAYEQPGLYFAYQLNELRATESLRMAHIIEARILAQQSDEEIALSMGNLMASTITWYESLFFNVRDRLQSPDWILEHVLMPAIDRSLKASGGGDSTKQALSAPFFDVSLKFFAYHGGPLVLDFMLNGFRRGVRPVNDDELSTWFDQYWVHRLRSRSAVAIHAFEINKFNVMELFNIHTRLMEIEKSKDSAEVKRDQMLQMVNRVFGQVPWAAGTAPNRMLANPAIEQYDTGAAELRSEELMLLSADRQTDTIGDIEKLTMPVTVQRQKGQEGRHNGQNAK